MLLAMSLCVLGLGSGLLGLGTVAAAQRLQQRQRGGSRGCALRSRGARRREQREAMMGVLQRDVARKKRLVRGHVQREGVEQPRELET